MHYLTRHQLLIPILLAADLAPESGSCSCGSSGIDIEVPGTATITQIITAPASEANCEVDPVRVEFQFVSNSESDPIGGPYDEQPLLVGPGLNPARSFVERKGIAVGSHYACIKQRTNGSVAYRFTGIDLSGYEADCFESQ